jgi:hypothetical protein
MLVKKGTDRRTESIQVYRWQGRSERGRQAICGSALAEGGRKQDLFETVARPQVVRVFGKFPALRRMIAALTACVVPMLSAFAILVIFISLCEKLPPPPASFATTLICLPGIQTTRMGHSLRRPAATSESVHCSRSCHGDK